MAQYARFSNMNPQWEQFVQSQPTLSEFRSSDAHIFERRAEFQRLAAAGPQWRHELLSIESNKNSDMLDVRSYNQLIRDILKAPPEDVRISFLLNRDHSRLLVRAYFQIAGLDPIRDEALLFARLLREHSGSKTLVHMYDGLPHGFWRFQEMPAAQDCADDLFEGTRFLLYGGEGGFEVKGSERPEDAGQVRVDGLTEYISGII